MSQVVEVNKEGTHVRRREEKVEVKIDDAWRRTVVVVGHQLGASVDDTRKRFSAAGTVLHVRNVDLNRKPLAPDLRKYTAASHMRAPTPSIHARNLRVLPPSTLQCWVQSTSWIHNSKKHPMLFMIASSGCVAAARRLPTGRAGHPGRVQRHRLGTQRL